MSVKVLTKEEMYNLINNRSAKMIWHRNHENGLYIEDCVYVYENTMYYRNMRGDDVLEYTEESFNQYIERWARYDQLVKGSEERKKQIEAYKQKRRKNI